MLLVCLLIFHLFSIILILVSFLTFFSDFIYSKQICVLFAHSLGFLSYFLPVSTFVVAVLSVCLWPCCFFFNACLCPSWYFFIVCFPLPFLLLFCLFVSAFDVYFCSCPCFCSFVCFWLWCCLFVCLFTPLLLLICLFVYAFVVIFLLFVSFCLSCYFLVTVCLWLSCCLSVVCLFMPFLLLVYLFFYVCLLMPFLLLYCLFVYRCLVNIYGRRKERPCPHQIIFLFFQTFASFSWFVPTFTSPLVFLQFLEVYWQMFPHYHYQLPL